jgi:hypothetical protein
MNKTYLEKTVPVLVPFLVLSAYGCGSGSQATPAATQPSAVTTSYSDPVPQSEPSSNVLEPASKPLSGHVPLPQPRPKSAPGPVAVKPPPAPASKPTPAAPQAPRDSRLGAPAWGNGSDRSSWTNAVRGVVTARLRDFERATDKETFCPGYTQASASERVNCWVVLVAAVTKFESAFHTADKFREPDGNYSVGLLALSPKECPNAQTISALSLATPNLVCGTNKMASLIARDGYIDGPASARGAAVYWSTLRAPYKVWDASRKRFLNLGKKNEVLPLTRGYRGSRVRVASNDQVLGAAMAELDAVGDELLSCTEVELLDSEGTKFRATDLAVTIRDAGDAAIADVHYEGRDRTENDTRVLTAKPSDVAQALEAARTMYPDRDFGGVVSVEIGDVGVQANQHDSSGIVIYDLRNADGGTVAKILTVGWQFGRCGR